MVDFLFYCKQNHSHDITRRATSTARTRLITNWGYDTCRPIHIRAWHVRGATWVHAHGTRRGTQRVSVREMRERSVLSGHGARSSLLLSS